MKQLDQRGHLNPLLVPFILVCLVLVGALSFAGWAFSSRQDYKTNSDAKAQAAVAVAVKNNSATKDLQFLEKEKLPLKTYNGPVAYGSLVLKYPKTWSAYISEKSNATTPVDAYFHPSFVPATDTPGQAFALRAQIISTSYAEVLKGFDSQVKSGKLKATAYVPARQQKVTGVRLDGDFFVGKQGSVVLLPIRDKTLKIWTESTDYLNDFNSNILPNYTFSQ